jgi:hypothetical protein
MHPSQTQGCQPWPNGLHHSTASIFPYPGGKKVGKSSSSATHHDRSLRASHLYHRAKMKHKIASLQDPRLPTPSPTICTLHMTSSQEPTSPRPTITLNDDTIQNTRAQEVSHGELTSSWTITPLETTQEELETEEIGLFKELEDFRDLPYQQ